MKIVRVLICLWLVPLNSWGKEATYIPTTRTASVIVPCCAKHARHLYPLLELYEKQSVLPDEVVIALSEAHVVDPAIVDAISDRMWAFRVTLLLTAKKCYAGENRNSACSHASGDIFICQDADDIPHPQRVEIIKHFFKFRKINHLMHQWFELKQGQGVSFRKYRELNKIPYTFPRWYDEASGLSVTNGNVALSRELFEKVRWSDLPRGQDTEFNKNVYAVSKNNIVIKTPLLAYRIFLSSAKKGMAVDEYGKDLYADECWDAAKPTEFFKTSVCWLD